MQKTQGSQVFWDKNKQKKTRKEHLLAPTERSSASASYILFGRKLWRRRPGRRGIRNKIFVQVYTRNHHGAQGTVSIAYTVSPYKYGIFIHFSSTAVAYGVHSSIHVHKSKPKRQTCSSYGSAHLCTPRELRGPHFADDFVLRSVRVLPNRHLRPARGKLDICLLAIRDSYGSWRVDSL